VAVDSDNNLFITDEENHKIRKIDSDGNVTTYAGTGVMGDVDGLAEIAQFNASTGVTVDTNHNVYVCDYGNHKIRKINTYGYTISPDLPQGLTFDNTTGIISGTPTTAMPQTDFTVTATNPNGSSSFVIAITVSALSLPDFNTSFVAVYPNPAKELLTIKAATAISEVEITNLLGQKIVKKIKLSSEEQLNISDLTSGWYFVKVTVADAVKTFKILKQ